MLCMQGLVTEIRKEEKKYPKPGQNRQKINYCPYDKKNEISMTAK